MKIGIDVDNVLRDFNGQLRDIYLKYNPGQVVPHQTTWTKYELDGYFAIGKGIYKFFTETHPGEIFLLAKPYPRSRMFMMKLREFGDVYIVSSQASKNLEDLTSDWLNLNGFVRKGDLYVTDKSRSGVDVLLDDCPFHLKAAELGGVFPVCFDQPYNRDYGGWRVSCYDDFLKLLRGVK